MKTNLGDVILEARPRGARRALMQQIIKLKRDRDYWLGKIGQAVTEARFDREQTARKECVRLNAEIKRLQGGLS